MDNITKTNLDNCIALFEHNEEYFDEKFPRKILRDNIEIARDMLDYLQKKYSEALVNLTNIANEYDISNKNFNHKECKDVIKNFHEKYREIHIDSIKRLYDHIWNAISSEMNDDGSIRIREEYIKEDELL